MASAIVSTFTLRLLRLQPFLMILQRLHRQWCKWLHHILVVSTAHTAWLSYNSLGGDNLGFILQSTAVQAGSIIAILADLDTARVQMKLCIATLHVREAPLYSIKRVSSQYMKVLP